VFRTVELLSDEFSIPSQDGVRLGDASHLLESLPAETFADFSQRERWASVNRSRAGRCARRILFSAGKYSFCSSSCWFTIPVTYTTRRATCVLFMQRHHHSLLISQRVRIFDNTGMEALLSVFERASVTEPLYRRTHPLIILIGVEAARSGATIGI